jgi:ribosome biogenesis GTPase
LPSENLSRRSLIRVKKWFEEKEQRLTKKKRQRGRKPGRSPENQRSDPPGGLTRGDTLLTGDFSHHAHAGIVDQCPEQTTPGETFATVVEVRASEALVSHDGRLVRARLISSLFSDTSTRSPVAVGDLVQITIEGAERARIERVMPRRSSLARGTGDASRRESQLQTHLLAANIDQVIVVSSASEPPFRPRLIDRYLVAASRDGLPALLCVNKVDLGLSNESEEFLKGYTGLGINVLLTSTVSGKGIESFLRVVMGKKSLLTGHSGVGKSSLLNAIEPGLARRVNSVTQTTAGRGKGTHTTTTSRLVPLSTPDTFLVDTPGIRSFGIIGLAPRDLAAHFPDIARLAASCFFRDCLHDCEQGCALPSASLESPFLKARWTSYRRLLGELH